MMIDGIEEIEGLREIRRLPEAEAIARWAELFAAGKQAGYARPDASVYGFLGRDPTWVEVEIPHDLYSAEWNQEDPALSSAQLERASEYARRPGRLPPGVALYSGRRRKGKPTGKAFVADGNHRAYAAFLRGEPAARFYMPLADWKRFAADVRSTGR